MHQAGGTAHAKQQTAMRCRGSLQLLRASDRQANNAGKRKATAAHHSLWRSSQLFFRRSCACQPRPAAWRQQQLERQAEPSGGRRRRRRRREQRRRRRRREQDPNRSAPVVGSFSSSLGGSTMSSSRPRSEVEVCRAAPQRCSSVGSEACSGRNSAMAVCCCGWGCVRGLRSACKVVERVRCKSARAGALGAEPMVSAVDLAPAPGNAVSSKQAVHGRSPAQRAPIVPIGAAKRATAHWDRIRRNCACQGRQQRCRRWRAGPPASLQRARVPGEDSRP